MASEQKYIVKSSNRVLGPYSIEEISTRVARREINMLDEIRTPEMRWCFVREVPAFHGLIERLRAEEMSRGEHTQTSLTHTSRTMTSTGITAIEEADTPVPVVGRDKVLSSQASTATYGLRSPAARASTSSPASLVRMVLIGLLILVGVVAAIQYFKPKSRAPGRAQMMEFARYAEELARLGRFSEALNFLKRDENNQYLSPDQLILKAKLLLIPPVQVVEARKALESMDKTQEDHLKNQITLVLALIALREQRWSEADQGFRSLSGAKLFEVDSKLNNAVLRYLTGNAAQAFQVLSAISSSAPQRSFAVGLKGLSLLNDRSGTIPIRPEAAAQEIEEVAESTREDRFKLNLIAAALFLRAGQRDQSQRVVDAMMNMNPFNSELFLRNLSVDYSPLDWERLSGLCDQVAQNTTMAQKGLALQAQCRFLEGQQGAALSLIEQARRQYASDLTLAAVHALLLRQADRAPEARSLTEFLDGKPSLLGELVRADSCIRDGEWSCAEKSLQIIRSLDSREPTVFYGLGLLAKQRGQSEVVRDMITQGLRLYPRYRPLLELKGDSYGF